MSDDLSSGPVAFGPTERAEIAGEFEVLLRRHVMEPWFPACVDVEGGGFLSDFDRRWRPGANKQRMLEFQARQTRTAARLALAYPSDGRWAEFALHGFRYLRDVMWDHQHGGWYWLIDRDGTAAAGETKHAHSTAYATQACVLVHLATGDLEARAMAEQGLSWIDSHGHDDEHGGYHNWFTREGRVIRGPDDVPPGVQREDPLGHDVGLKDVNVIGDWFESLTEFTAVIHDATAETRFAEFGRLYLDRMTTSRGEVHATFLPDWMPLPQPERYGYNAQAVRRMFAAGDRPPDGHHLLRRAVVIGNQLIDKGMPRGGGVRFAGPSGMGTVLEGVSLVVKRRVWWVQVEALCSLAMLAARATDDSERARFVKLLRRQWIFVRDRATDPVYNGFYVTCPEDLPFSKRPLTRWHNDPALHKGDPWKDASHEADSLLFAIEALRTSASQGSGVPLRSTKSETFHPTS